MIALGRKTLIYEWRRFLPAVLAVGFCGVLLAVQAALVLGIFGSAAIYVTGSSADLWAGYPGTQSVNFGRPIGPDVEMRLRMDPDVIRAEPYVWVDGDWRGRSNVHGGVSVFVSGIDTAPEALMFSRFLSAGSRELLRVPGTVIVDRADLEQLGVGLDGVGWINGGRVRVVGVVNGLRALGGVNVLASLDTARTLVSGPAPADLATYFVARLRDPQRADQVRARIHADPAFGPFEVWTAREFARRSQHYWLFGTGAGVAVMFMAAIVCLVGAVITSQALMGMVLASTREYATLNALGASFASLSRVVLEQSVWVGGLGLIVATFASALLLALAANRDVPVAMSLQIGLICGGLVLGLALISGVIAVRGLWRADPAMLLR